MKENEELSFPEAVLSSSFPNLWLERKREERETASASLRSVHFLYWNYYWRRSVWERKVPDSQWSPIDSKKRKCPRPPSYSSQERYEKNSRRETSNDWLVVCLSFFYLSWWAWAFGGFIWSLARARRVFL